MPPPSEESSGNSRNPDRSSFKTNIVPFLDSARFIQSQLSVDNLGPVSFEALSGSFLGLELRFAPVGLSFVKEIFPRLAQIRNGKLQTSG